jgi:hypothetical protein
MQCFHTRRDEHPQEHPHEVRSVGMVEPCDSLVCHVCAMFDVIVP